MKPEKKTYEQMRDASAFKLQRKIEEDYPQQALNSEDVYYSYKQGSDWAVANAPLSVLAERNEGVRELAAILKEAKQALIILENLCARHGFDLANKRTTEVKHMVVWGLRQLEDGE